MEPTNTNSFARLMTALLCPAVFLFVPAPAAYCSISSGSDYELTESAIDNGGGSYASGGEYLSRGSVAPASLPDNNAGLSGGGYSNLAGFYNPPFVTFQSALATSFLSDSGDYGMTIPAGSLDKEGFEITMNADPLGAPLNVNPNLIRTATDKMVFNEGEWSQVAQDRLVEISIFDTQGYYTKPLANKALLTMHYKPDAALAFGSVEYIMRDVPYG